MGKPKAPKPVDPRITADAQTSTNIATAIARQNLNNVNQQTPYGSLRYAQSGSHKFTDPNSGKTYDMPSYTATQTLNPNQQEILRRGEQAGLNLAQLASDQSGRIGKLLSRPLDTSSLPSAGDPNAIGVPQLQRLGAGPQLRGDLGDAGDVRTSYGADFSPERQRVEDALMDRLSPHFERDRKGLESRLAAQGIRMGSQAYSSAMDDFSRRKNDARLGAVLGAGQEHSRLDSLAARRAGFENQAQAQRFGQQATRLGAENLAMQQMRQNQQQTAAFNNQAAMARMRGERTGFDAANAARNQALREQFAARNQPINEIAALLSGSQVKNPNFINPPQAQLPTTDFAGIQNTHAATKMRNYQQRLASWNNLWGGLMGLGSGAMMASDRRVKKNIKRVGKTNDGQNIYRFRYKGGGPIQLGLMAQEVEKTKPKAVAKVGGIKMVDYERALK